MTRTLPRRDFLKASKQIKVGQSLSLNSLLEEWLQIGYQPADTVLEPGQFSHRGGLLDIWPQSLDGTTQSLAALKNLTSELIGRFCVAAQEATRAAAGDGPLTRYTADLVVPRQQRLECALLKAVAMHYVMGREGAAQAQALERELLTELVHAVERGAPATLDPQLRQSWHAAATDAERRRVVIDQEASLTDTSARAWHHRLTSR